MADPPTFARGLPADCGPMLDLLAQSWPEPERSLQRQVLASALASDARHSFVCIRAVRGNELLGVVLAQQLPGSTAAVYPPQAVATASSGIRGQLMGALDAALRNAGIVLAQSLLAVDQTGDESHLAACGFTKAATLLYMACEPLEGNMPTEQTEIAFEPVATSNESRLRHMLEATYEATLDCPLLNGLRTTEDVLAGYRAVGTYRPDWWLLARREDQDIGCLLLADHPDAGNLELVYLGVIPEVRGRGYGLKLVQQTLWVAREHCRERVVLAVDAANAPAIGMYEAAGFFGFDQRVVMIKKLT